ncbi:hypothetical protein MRB53_031320 [Persea americana]|uniref:Uncharacterized protein n=1 Tax=Persea americana TaxID=3435 RepID=A0ACC2KPK6_PERAE|nr:hypothetical protein MRB53_031320 [Persea americana]
MASEAQPQPHFLMIPLMAQGHMIPMIDMARLFANRGVAITIITTPLNASRFKAVIDRASQSGLQIQLVELPFPCLDMGLPEGCENFDLLPSPEVAINFFAATEWFQLPVERFLEELDPLPICIISDLCLPWTSDTGRKFGIPRIVFHGPCCFSILSIYNVINYKPYESATSQSDPFVIPGLPDRVEITKAQLPEHLLDNPRLEKMFDKFLKSQSAAYGAIINSFYELEPEYINRFQKATGLKAWSIGPVSLCNSETLDQVERGNKASINEARCSRWLDSKKPNSVVYTCFGSQNREQVKKAVERLMDERGEGQEIRKRARELGNKARRAMEDGGSSYVNLALFIEDMVDHANEENSDDSEEDKDASGV